MCSTTLRDPAHAGKLDVRRLAPPRSAGAMLAEKSAAAKRRRDVGREERRRDVW
jgi:hypothetical protein